MRMGIGQRELDLCGSVPGVCRVIYEWLAVLPHYYLTKRKWCTGTVWHHTPRAFALAEVV